MGSPNLAQAALLLLLAASAALGERGKPGIGAALLQQSAIGSRSGSSADSASSSGSSSSGGSQPASVRLALGDAAGELTVMWSTQLPTAEACVQLVVLSPPPAAAQAGGGRSSSGSSVGQSAAQLAPPFVGPLLLPLEAASGSAGSEGSGGAATARRVLQAPEAAAGEPPAPSVQTVCGSSAPFIEPATGQPSLQLHTVALRGLPPGQAVRYRCGSAGGGWSEWRVFRAPRAPQQFGPDAPARLLIVGDLGLYNSRCWPYIEGEVVGTTAASGSSGGGSAGSSDEGGATGAAGRGTGLPSSGASSRTVPPGSSGAAGSKGSAAAGSSGSGGAASTTGAAAAGSSSSGEDGSSVPPPAAYDALLHVGDIAYDLESLAGRRASAFLRMVEPAAAHLPYIVAPGNHEWHANFSHYRALFAMPQRRRGENLFYSFDVGPLHVLVYNTEVFFWPELFGEEHMRAQYEWMEANLKAANANRQRTPWILAAGHRPMYCVRAHDGRCSKEQEASRLGIPSFCPHNNPAACRPLRPPGSGPTFPIEQLFQRYGVDLAVFGHVHDYERYWPVANRSFPTPPPDDDSSSGSGALHTDTPGSGSPDSSHSSGSAGAASSLSFRRYLNPRATVHVTSGSGGNAEMRNGEEPPPRGRCGGSAPWCAFQSGFAPAPGRSYEYSFSRLEAFNASHLRWQQVSCLEGGRLVDEFWVEQAEHGPFS